MKSADNLLFARVNAIPILDKEQAAREILELDIKHSFWDDYRYTRMFPLMTKNGSTGQSGTSNRQEGQFAWTEFTPQIIIDWCETYVFPWIGMKTRVMALITEPGVANHEHIDCNPDELHTLQHKFRIVLQGKTDTLYWKTSNGDVAAPDIEEAFVMDGGWPHGMINSTGLPKVTLALGAPWNGKDNYDSDITLLQDRNNFVMPDQIDHLWSRKK